ncbi:hypothetical protein ACFL35_20075 [Candidatus Riflebacteria bacterium]
MKSLSNNGKHLTLDEVKVAFNHWRKLKPRPRRIPEELWMKVFELLNYHSKWQAIKELGINSDSLTKKLKNIKATKGQKKNGLNLLKTIKCSR